ncbi:MAG TPA: ABC transporter ATP-binding protein [Flavobacteriaceae bacterium]|jgi:subfamily B ATP-binding cassette protein MsbA|nr:antibiotic ABC transporter ATP-binding protein [Flavobacteriaceae bacterium]MAY53043.1 antibiotic ABC transporter ATP-binding protein [Flavobacteriaceae bacterium]HBR55522.1 antibiotic ABC transporter ATP-binding protein [Flavobacteriaceae bacterium]HIB48911.1 ABC transporter ATP-binding protein [Flavobacteriaceae bacterium]HIN97822.1 ABC transporter ATP-binding protein [Flavobacteriaceae bacterium]|tara:strand:+ start:271 stop:2037 length:1767 start_codon:yes stop_codon:yes gene_type:complete
MAKESGKAFDFKLFKRLLAFTNAYRGTFYFVAFAAIAMSGLAVLSPHLLRLAIDNAMFNRDLPLLQYYLMLMLGVLVLEVFFQLSFIYYANWLGQNVIKDIRVKLFKLMTSFKMKYFDKSAVGRLTTRAVNDIETISSIFSQGLFMIISDLLKMLTIAGVMLYMSWRLSLIVFAILPLIIYATRVFQRAMKVAFEEVRNQVANLNSFVQERITGMKIVQIFTREETEYKRFIDINQKHKKAWVKTVWYNSIFFPIAEMASSIAIGLIVWYGGLNAAEGGVITLGIVTAFIQYSQMLFRPLRQIADKFNTLQMGMVAANRVFGILDTKSHISNEGEKVLTDAKGAIAFENVRFGYNEKEEVIKDISFKVYPGETIAIVGATGAGKSTIINLLNRFYEINSGTIKVDRVDIKEYTLASLRSQIAVVLQDVFLFADTILNNITLNDTNISEEEVIEAAKAIGVHKFITSLPNGYHYNVKERGSMLSSGQRQLIAFLRAYVSNPSILILDEATSSVDSYSEEMIQAATDKITQGRTSIVIAHRLATIKKADKILVMDAGKIVESGTHLELLERPDGYYKNLYEVQFMTEEAI